MTIDLDKFKIKSIREELYMMYEQKAYCSEEIGRGCYDSTGTSLRIIKLDASIESTRNILRIIGINAYYVDGKVVLWNNADDCEIVE